MIELKTPDQNKDVFSEFNFYVVPDLTPEERTPPDFLISEMIPEVGISMLCGKPKTRKSFLALQMAIAVASGKSFFGYPVKQTSVALLDLEGSKSRISTRTLNMTIPIPRNVYVTNKVTERLADGKLITKIQRLHQERPDIGLIIIDTYGKARGKPRSSGQNAYDADIELFSPLTDMVMEEKLALLFVHHENKSRFNTDDFDSVSGSTGITGSCDSVLQLKSIGKRFDGRAELSCTPRDSRGTEITLEFNERNTEWQQVSAPELSIMESPLCRWILSNRPDPKTTGDFYSYQDVHKLLFGFSADRAGERIKQEISPYLEPLFCEYHIAVQSGIKYGGERGIRLVSVM